VALSRRALLVSLAAIPALALQPSAQDRRHSRLFKPEQLGVLEGPDREAWQKPDLIMDDLGIFDGSTVADVAAGGGWFTVRLARRVGPTGRIYAEDIQTEMIETMNRRIQRESLKNVEVVLGTAVDARLPRGALDAVLIVGSYGEFENPVALLRNLRTSLRPNGRIGVVDFRSDGLGPGPPLEDRPDPGVVIKDAEAAGLRLVKRDTPLPFQFLLVFSAVAPAPPPRPTR
jgi:ubiquinone/menaquinone biosynthesis C-methylase UbiE